MPKVKCGNPDCNANALSGDEFCYWHSPAAEQRRKAGHKKLLNKMAKRGSLKALPPEPSPEPRKRGRPKKVVDPDPLPQPVSTDTWGKLDRVAQARYRIHRLLIVAALIGRRGLQADPRVPKALTFEAARALLAGHEGWAGYDTVLRGMIEQLAYLQHLTPEDCWREFVPDIPFEPPVFDALPAPTPRVVPKQDDVFKPLEVRVSTPEPQEMHTPVRFREPEPEVNPQDLAQVRLAIARRRRQQLLNGGSA